MIGKQENSRCYFCDGIVEAGVATVPFTVDSNVVIVKHVPARICAQCGEVTLGSEVASVIDRLLKQTQQVGLEVSVVSYEQLTQEPVPA